MNTVEQRVITVDRSGRMVAFLEWAYGTDMPSMNFCRLFWSLVASPVVAAIRALGMAAQATRVGPELADKLADAGDRNVERLQRHPRLRKVLFVAWLTVCVGYLLFLLVLLTLVAWWALLIPGNVIAFGWVLWLGRDTYLVRFLGHGYHAVKDRTCPRVEVIDSSGVSV
jgi:hypothetical protein